MAKLTSTYNNVASLNKALSRLTKVATETLRRASLEIADDVAAEARGRALAVGGVAKHVAPTIKGTRDRVPAIRMGGAARLRTSRRRTGPNQENQAIGNVIWGAEFGGQRRPTTQQFRPYRGSGRGAGYFLWETVRDNSEQTQERYSKALLDALRAI